MVDFFISYTNGDRRWAEWMAWVLEEAGYTAVLQAWDFRPGGDLKSALNRAVMEARRIISVVSEDYLEGVFPHREWVDAYAARARGEKRKVIPVRVKLCQVDGLLDDIRCLDVAGTTDEAEATRRLLGGIRKERAAPRAQADGSGTRTVPTNPGFPGALPASWNVPPRNPSFTGREDLLRALRQSLVSSHHAALTHTSATLGGLGKTQCVVEYAHRHVSDYRLVWWVRCEQPAQFAADYAALATALDLPGRDEADQPSTIAAVRRWLERNEGWLLVFDNVPQAEALRGYLPARRVGHVLITSRNPNWRAPIRITVPPLSRADSVALFRKRTGRADGKAEALAEALGDIPLALEQAAAYIVATDCGFDGYLDLFHSRRQELWMAGRPPDGPEAMVAATCGLALAEAAAKCPEAQELLYLCAYLGPEAVPLALVRQGAELLPPALAATAEGPSSLTRAIAALQRYSLAAARGDSLSVHRLVQALVREGLSREEQAVWAGAAVAIVSQGFPLSSEDPRTWPECNRRLPHGLIAAGHADELGANREDTGRLLDRAGRYLHCRSQFAQAKACFERALAIVEQTHGPDRPEVGTSANNLGRVLYELGELEQAKAHFARALAIGEETHGPDHPTVAIRANNLGSVLRLIGDLEGARVHLERALAIGESTYGRDHPTVATRAGNVGNVLWDLGDLEGAKAHFARALEIDEQAYGPDHVIVARDLHSVASVLRAMGDLEGAQEHCERALYIDEQAYGPDHPAVATRLGDLAGVLCEMGGLEEAKACYERALRIDERAYGPDHSTVARHASDLGNVLGDLGDVEGARASTARALRILETTLGGEHPDTMSVRRNLEALEARLNPPKLRLPSPAKPAERKRRAVREGS
jgi:tetratricopeptide (TPR) repeat protein